MKSNKIFYGWIIVAAGCVVMATTTGIVTNCTSLFIKPIADGLGISRQMASMVASIANLGGMVASFFAGRIFNEKNIVRVMRIAVIVLVGAYFLNSLAESVYLLYASYLVCGVCLALLSSLPFTFLINNWFHDRVGFAFALTSMGTGIGGALFNVIGGHLIGAVGWRGAYRILALFILVLAVPCIFFLLRLRPEDMGLTPYTEGGDAADADAQGAASAEETGYTHEEVLGMPLYWTFCVFAILIGIAVNGIHTSVTANLQDKGYTLEFSASVMSACLLAIAAGKIVLGRIFDSFGVRVGFCWACLCLTTAAFGLVLAKMPLGLVLTVLGIGNGCIFGAVVFPLSTPLVFGKRDYHSIIGPVSALVSLGGVIGPTLGGYMFDVTGSYDSFYYICAGILLVSALVMSRLLPNKQEQF